MDIGGTGIKGAPVDLAAGAFTAERIRIPTPQPATPDAVAAVVKEIVTQLDAPGTIGLTLPSVVLDGVVQTAANIDQGWIGTDAEALFQEATGRPVGVVNDADAAGIAEMRFGAGKDRHGVVLLLTLGTGIGSALFVDGTLGAEHRARPPAPPPRRRPRTGPPSPCGRTTTCRGRSGADRLSDYMELVEKLLWPNLIIIGGGVSKKSDKFLPHVRARTEIVPAQLLNDAGIVGAALFAPTA